MPLTPVFDAIGVGASGNTLQLTHNHTIGNNAGRVVYYSVAIKTVGNDDGCTGVTFNGVSMFPLITVYNATDGIKLQIYRLVNPPVGTYSVVANFSSLRRKIQQTHSYYYVHQTSIERYVGSGTGSSTTPSHQITNAQTGFYCIDSIAQSNNATFTPGANQTERYEGSTTGSPSGNNASLEICNEPSAPPNVDMTHTSSQNTPWAICGIELTALGDTVTLSASMSGSATTNNPSLVNVFSIIASKISCWRNWEDVPDGNLSLYDGWVKTGGGTDFNVTTYYNPPDPIMERKVIRPVYEGGLVTSYQKICPSYNQFTFEFDARFTGTPVDCAFGFIWQVANQPTLYVCAVSLRVYYGNVHVFVNVYPGVTYQLIVGSPTDSSVHHIEVVYSAMTQILDIYVDYSLTPTLHLTGITLPPGVYDLDALVVSKTQSGMGNLDNWKSGNVALAYIGDMTLYKETALLSINATISNTLSGNIVITMYLDGSGLSGSATTGDATLSYAIDHSGSFIGDVILSGDILVTRPIVIDAIIDSILSGNINSEMALVVDSQPPSSWLTGIDMVDRPLSIDATCSVIMAGTLSDFLFGFINAFTDATINDPSMIRDIALSTNFNYGNATIPMAYADTVHVQKIEFEVYVRNIPTKFQRIGRFRRQTP